MRFDAGVDGRFGALEAQPGGRAREGVGGEDFRNGGHAAGRLARFVFPAHGALQPLFVAVSPFAGVPVGRSRSVGRVVGGRVVCDAGLGKSGVFETEVVFPRVFFERSERDGIEA